MVGFIAADKVYCLVSIAYEVTSERSERIGSKTVQERERQHASVLWTVDSELDLYIMSSTRIQPDRMVKMETRTHKVFSVFSLAHFKVEAVYSLAHSSDPELFNEVDTERQVFVQKKLNYMLRRLINK